MSAARYAEIAGRIGTQAVELSPSDHDPYAQTLKLAIYHLRSAARLIRELAESKIAKEEQ